MRDRTLQTFGTNRYLLEALNSYSVEYIIVGGVAVNYYDPTREFDDLDLQINPTEVNAQRTIDALKSLGVGVEFDAQQLAGPTRRIDVKHTYFADIVTPAANFQFDDALAAAHDVMVNGVPVRLASRQTLIELKSTDWPKDQDDVRRLKGS